MTNNFHVQWHITNHCPLHCRHCYQDDFSPGSDLDWAGLKMVAENLLAAIAGWNLSAAINLTGGEPLLKPELFPLLEYLNSHPAVAELGIITNGLFLDEEILERLAAFPKLAAIKISLDGPEAAINDALRPPGTFAKVVENISLLRRNNRFAVILMFTALKRNYQSLPAFIRLGQDLGAEALIIERFIPWGRGRGLADEVLAKNQWRELSETLWQFFSLPREKGDPYPYQAFQINFQGREPELLGAPCVLGIDGFCLMPDGTLFPCRRFPLPIGNLLENSLQSLWENSAILTKLRSKKNLKGKCGHCALKECRGCRSLAYSLTGDYLQEDPHCWLFD